jgi:hypothetical protein
MSPFRVTTFRKGLGLRRAGIAAVCLMLLCLTPPPAAARSAETPALVLRAPEIPLAAVATGSPVRPEKQFPHKRLTPLKPLRLARHITLVSRALPSPRPGAHQPYRDVPRRPLPTRRAAPRAPDDPAH